MFCFDYQLGYVLLNSLLEFTFMDVSLIMIHINGEQCLFCKHVHFAYGRIHQHGHGDVDELHTTVTIWGLVALNKSTYDVSATATNQT